MRRCVALVLLALEWTACASPRPALEVGTAPRALTGMFTYMADAAVIVLCGQSEPMPVAMEAAFKALQAAYLKERPQLGQAILVTVEGRVEPRPSAEEPASAPEPHRRSLRRHLARRDVRQSSDREPSRAAGWSRRGARALRPGPLSPRRA